MDNIITPVYKKYIVSFLLVVFLVYLPVPVFASHVISFDVDKPNGYYVSGKDKVTFTITNTGQDTAYVSCGGIKVWQQQQGQQNMVAQEINSCYVLQGAAVAISYEINAGNSHTWQWDQTYQNSANQNLNGQQVPNGEYLGEIVTYTDLKTGAQAIYTSLHFKIDSDTDGDGVADAVDKCNQPPGQVAGYADNDKDGCDDRTDTDLDGIPDSLDDCMYHAGKPTFNGCPDKDNDGFVDFKDLNKDRNPDPNSPDQCPGTYGTVNGCPDSDGDGIQDYRDPNGDGYNILDSEDSDVDKCDNAKETPNNYRDEDGCPDKSPKEIKQENKPVFDLFVNANYNAAFTLTGFALLAPPPFGALGFIAETVVIVETIKAQARYERDPPDVVNYKEVFVPNLRWPEKYNIVPTNTLDIVMLTFDKNMFFGSRNLDAVTTSIERHDGAILMKDYKSANTQAVAVRKFAAETKNKFVVAADFAEKSAKELRLRPQLDYINLRAAQEQVKRNGLPQIEIDFAKSMGANDAEIKNLREQFLSADTNKIDPKLSKNLQKLKSHILRFTNHIDHVSKTFGANLYISPESNNVEFRNGITSFGVYYENAPSDAKTFSFVVSYDKKLKFVDCKISSGSCNAKLLTGNKLLVSGSVIETINYGGHGHLLDLKFKKSIWSWFYKSNRYILEVSNADGDMKGWLGSPNFNSFCKYEPKSLICTKVT